MFTRIKKHLLASMFIAPFIFQIPLMVAKAENPINQRIYKIKNLLTRAVNHFEKHSVAQSCHDFAKKNSWREGNAFLALFDKEGTCFIFNGESMRSWSDFSTYRDADNILLVEKIFKTNTSQVSWFFNNLTMEIYTHKVKKDNKEYVLGCCFYPSTQEYFAIKLVEKTIQSFQAIGIPQTFILVNNPYGSLVKGDMYVTVFDQDGYMHASGETYAQLGKAFFKSDTSKYTASEQEQLKNFTESNDTSHWITIKSDAYGSVRKKSYLKKYFDPISHMTYVVSANFYEGVDDDTAYAFGQKAISYLKVRGKDESLAEFNNPTSQFFYGGMRISVYTPEGLCLAHGEDPTFVGHNVLNRMSSNGQFYIRELIDAVKKYGKVWVSQFDKNSYKLIYAERISLPDGVFIVASGYYVNSDKNLVMGMVERAIDYIKRHTFEQSILKFVSTDSLFLRGNIHISLFGTDGICLADGPFGNTKIWSYMRTRDDLGQEIIRKILDMANQGGGWITYKQFNANYHTYVRRINSYTQEGGIEPLIILSGYYD